MRRGGGLVAGVRDAILVAAIAVVVVQALRRIVGDRYMVPSDSMQPVLFGDERHGDVVFVDKLARAASCRRHDLVVVQHPEKDGSQLVKRIAAVGDDPAANWIDLERGDVWLGPDRQRLSREVKDPLEARAMQVSWARVPGPGADFVDLAGSVRDGDAWSVAPFSACFDDARVVFRDEARRERRRLVHAVPAGCIGTTKPVDASYIDANGARGSGHELGVHDCAMALDLAAPVELSCTIDSSVHALTFHADLANGRIALWCNGVEVATNDANASAFRVAGRHRIEFGFLDDRAYFVVDDRRDAMFVVPREPAWPSDPPTALGPRAWLYVGVLGTTPATIRTIAVTRDVFAWKENILGFESQPGDWPRFVPPGHWFLLGDNPYDSRDSRHFGPRPASDFIGRPRIVLGPWPRCRWLAP